MALVIRGRDKSNKVRIQQWANDWFMANGKIYKPTSLELTQKEYELVKANPCGVLNEYRWRPVGTLKGSLYRFERREIGC